MSDKQTELAKVSGIYIVRFNLGNNKVEKVDHQHTSLDVGIYYIKVMPDKKMLMTNREIALFSLIVAIICAMVVQRCCCTVMQFYITHIMTINTTLL